MKKGGFRGGLLSRQQAARDVLGPVCEVSWSQQPPLTHALAWDTIGDDKKL